MIRLGLALVGALFLFVSLVTPARAQFSLPDSMPSLPPGEMICNKGGTVCLVNKTDLNAIRAEVFAQFTAAQLLEQQLRITVAYAARLQADLNVCRPPATLRVLPGSRT